MIQEAVRMNRYHEKDLKLSFWRTTSGGEVDLLFSRGNTILLAVEFKNSPYPSSRDLSGLKSFHEEYPKAHKFLCAPVEHSLVLDQFLVLPPKELLAKIKGL